MISELKRKEIQTVKEMLDSFNEKINSFKSDMEAIDIKYKKLAEDEKKDLKSNLADVKSQIKLWQKIFDNFDTTLVKEVLGDKYESNTTIDELPEETVKDSVEEVVEDTLDFGEDVETVEPEQETEETAPVSNEVEADITEEEASAMAADVFAEANIEDFPEATADIPVSDTEEGWPELPEEWKN